MSKARTLGLFVLLTFVLARPASATTITLGFTFAVASAEDTAIGTHFHSNTGGAFGNPAGKAEIGRYLSEEIRGLSEYDLTGLSVAPSAFVTFDVFQLGGLFGGTNDFAFDGTIQVLAYAGNNTEDISDYQAASLGLVGSFSTAGLALGDILSFDITSLFNTAITNGDTSLGIRLAAVPLGPSNTGALTFDDFRLTTDDQSTAGVVPEPSTIALLGTGLLAFARRRRRAPRGNH